MASAGDGVTWVLPLGWEEPMEKEKTTHSSILAWKTPWTEEPGGLQSRGSQWVRQDWATEYTHKVRSRNDVHGYKHLCCCCCCQVASVMSESVQPHRRQPTRLLCPWDSPGKNTGVGCHFLLQCMKVEVKSFSRARLLATPWTAGHQAPPPMGFSRQEYWSGVLLPSPQTSLDGINFWSSLMRKNRKFDLVRTSDFVLLNLALSEGLLYGLYFQVRIFTCAHHSFVFVFS